MSITSQNTITESLSSTASSIKKKLQEEGSSFLSEFQAALESAAKPSTSSSTQSTSSSDSNVQAFLDDLKEKGALAFYQEYNFDKIEKIIEEKKQELMDKLGLSPDSQPPLTGKDRQDALTSLDQMLDDFRKQLQEKMQAKDTLDQKNTTLSTFLQKLV